MEQALYHLIDGARGLNHDSKLWEDVAREQANMRKAEKSPLPGKFACLADAAEQLRRLSRNAQLTARESMVLSKALAIVEREAGSRPRAA